MEGQLIDFSLTQGIFAALFVCLFIYTTRKSDERERQAREREDRLMAHIDRTTVTLNKIENSIVDMRDEIKNVQDKMNV